MKHEWQSVPMPDGIAARPRDARGFPITFVTLIGPDGRPDFTTIDAEKIYRCCTESLCGMCGLGWPHPTETRPDDHLAAFIGGPLSIENQNFLDPPMHVQCAEYAMKVCPHIAIDTSRYSKPKGDEEGIHREFFQEIHPDRPEKFGLMLTSSHEVALFRGQPIFLPTKVEGVIWQEDLV